MKGKTKAIITVFVVILAGIYYYAAIPAINIHSSETWFFIMIVEHIGSFVFAVNINKSGTLAFCRSTAFVWVGGGEICA